MPIIDKYNLRVKKVNSLVCVGLDSDYSKLPDKFKKSKSSQFDFNKWIIEQTYQYVAAYKPNIAFYEARGDQGIRELKQTMDYLRKKHPDIFTICDCKRADIGNTNQGYVDSLFDWFGFDAITIHPYLGSEALEPFLIRKDNGCIILCRTSNSGAGELQDLKVKSFFAKASKNEQPLWRYIATMVVRKWNKNNNCMLVVGATYPKEMKTIRALTGDMTFLVPGVGAQGGNVEDVVKSGLNSKGNGLIINSARGIIFSDNPAREAVKLKDEINLYR